jgi:iron complex outermembrane receptor protein
MTGFDPWSAANEGPGAGACGMAGRLAVAAVCALAAASSQAQEASLDAAAPILEPVAVLAQKRPELVQDVPIEINVFSADELARSGITSVLDLSNVVPGLVMQDVVGYSLPYLRGIGTTATGPGFENPIATYVDGVYYAAQAGGLTSLNKVLAVEVDKGPQGTLFGRNSTGGAIQIRTLDPSETFAETAELGHGSYDTSTAKLYVSGGLARNLAANVAVNYMDQGHGYGTNLATGQDVDRNGEISLRGKLKFSTDEDNSVIMGLDYSRTRDIPVLAPAPGTIPQFNPPVSSNPRDVYGNPQPFGRTTQWGTTLTVDRELSFATLTSISAYRQTELDTLFDSTLTALPGTTFFIDTPEPHRQASQEFHLASSGGGNLDWVTGAFLFWEHSGLGEVTTIGGDSFASQGLPSGILQAPDDKTYSGALFAQGTYNFSQATAATVGLRETDEKKTSSFVQTLPDFDQVTADFGRENFKNLTWRYALQHRFDSTLMAFVSYNRGFKSGGFNDGTAFQPETLDDVEAGFKGDFLSNRLRVNATAFHYSYTNIQTVTYPNGNLFIINGAGARLYGLDLDTAYAVMTNFRLTGSLERLHSDYTSFPDAPISVPVPGGGTAYGTQPNGAAGNELPKAPHLTASVAADYSTTIDFCKLSGNVTYAYDSGWFGEADNRLRQPSYSVVNAELSAGRADDRLVVRLWTKNLLNKTYGVMLASQTNGDYVQYAPPRTLGVSVMQRF